MEIVIILIVLAFIGLFLAIPVAGLVVFSQSQAKKEAKKILASGKIDNPKKYKRTMSILAKTDKDLEAADLWHKLQQLQETQVT
ncbi:hypothetical protein ACFLX5_05935 [Chloroflexota bacterium]